MPRNGSGTMTVSNSFSSGTTIASSAVNANFSDIASEITGSLPRDGQAAMTGQLKAASGSVSAPGLSFSTDTGSGWYRIASNNIGFAINGVKVLDVDSAGFDVVGALTTTTTLTVGTTLTVTGASTLTGAVTFAGGGAFGSGTFTGAPTFSGNIAFTGTPTFTALTLPSNAVATANLQDSAVTVGKLPTGLVVQHGYVEIATTASTATAIPYDDTIPTNSEGAQALTLSYTPLSATNYLVFDISFHVSNTGTGNIGAVTVFDGSTLIGMAAMPIGVNDRPYHLGARFRMTAGSTSSKTFTVRYGADAGTTSINSQATGPTRRYGGALVSSLTITEVKA